MDADFKLESFERYFGEVEEVVKQIDECEKCGAKLIFTHFTDYKNYLVQETSRCLDCGLGGRKALHVLN